MNKLIPVLLLMGMSTSAFASGPNCRIILKDFFTIFGFAAINHYPELNTPEACAGKAVDSLSGTFGCDVYGHMADCKVRSASFKFTGEHVIVRGNAKKKSAALGQPACQIDGQAVVSVSESDCIGQAAQAVGEARKANYEFRGHGIVVTGKVTKR